MWTVGAIAVVQVVAMGLAVLIREPLPTPQYSMAVGVPQALNTGVSPSFSPQAVPSEPGMGGPVVAGETATGGGSPGVLAPLPVDQRSGVALRPDSTSQDQEPGAPVPGELAGNQPEGGNGATLAPGFVGPGGESIDSRVGSRSAGIPVEDPIPAGAEESVAGIEDPLLGLLVTTGRELRAGGNMQGALKALRQAETALPDHPVVLSELAVTFEQMGLDEKARGYWERVDGLGPDRAGDYFAMAHRFLSGETAPVETSSSRVLRLGSIDVDELPPGQEGGQRVSLRVLIEGDPRMRPSGGEMAMLVYFYDLVEGERVDSSTADTQNKYPTEPYDWQDGGTEEIEVIYYQPPFTEEQERELGTRTYHGYVIELYYRDQLQDTVAMPESLHAKRREELNQSPAPPGSPGPENALFPGSPSP